MHKVTKISWFSIIISSLAFCGCDDSNGSSDKAETEDTTVCSCNLSDKSCVDDCIYAACDCEKSVKIEECADGCMAASSCNIINRDFDPGEFEMSIEVKVTAKSQLTCMQQFINECDDSFETTCDGNRVKSCKSGLFSYHNCEHGCEKGACKTEGTADDLPELPKADSPCSYKDIDKCLDDGKIILTCESEKWKIETDCSERCVARKNDPNHMLLKGCGTKNVKPLPDYARDLTTAYEIVDNDKVLLYKVSNCPIDIYEGDDDNLYYERNYLGCIYCDTIDDREQKIQATPCHSGSHDKCDEVNNKSQCFGPLDLYYLSCSEGQGDQYFKCPGGCTHTSMLGDVCIGISR